MNLIQVGEHVINLDFVARISPRKTQAETDATAPHSWVDVEFGSGAVITLRGQEAEEFRRFIAANVRTLDGRLGDGSESLHPTPTASHDHGDSPRPNNGPRGGRRDYVIDPDSPKSQADGADQGSS